MNKYYKTIVLIGVLLIVLTVCFLPTNVLADAGNVNRYSNGSDSSSGSADDVFSMLIYFALSLVTTIPGLIILGICIACYFILKKSGKIDQMMADFKDVQTSLNGAMSNPTFTNNIEYVEDQIRLIDPYFSEDAFLGFTREVFIKIQQAWTNRDWSVIRPFESNELFAQHQAQLQEYINNNKINVIEKISINHVRLRDFKQDGDKEVIVVELHAVMRDYVIDANSKQVLESNPNKDWNMRYLMTFNRKTGVKTVVGTNKKATTNCPNCGAPTQITSSGMCEYCGSVITTGEYDWVLSDIRGIN